MAYGLSTTGMANLWLNTLGGSAATPGTTLFAYPTSADPGANGTANVAANLTPSNSARPSLSWSAASGGSKSISANVEWTATGASTCHGLTVWDASSGGNFRFSVAFTTSRTLASGEILRLTNLTVSLTPLAA